MVLDHGIVARAVRHAFWLAMLFFDRGEMGRGGGWLGRATTLLEEHDLDAVERGYVLIPQGLRAMDSGDAAGALEIFERIAEVADRFSDPDLATMARLGRGRSLIGLAQIERGVAVLDEAMVAVTSGEVSPVTTGIVYCAAIEAFHEVFDLRRAQEWTAALGAWCDRHPDLIPFRGRCLLFGPSSCSSTGRGLRRSRKSSEHSDGCCALHRSPRSGRRFTSRPSSTGCVVSSAERTRPIERPARGVGGSNPDFRCFVSRRARRMPPGR